MQRFLTKNCPFSRCYNKNILYVCSQWRIFDCNTHTHTTHTHTPTPPHTQRVLNRDTFYIHIQPAEYTVVMLGIWLVTGSCGNQLPEVAGRGTGSEYCNSLSRGKGAEESYSEKLEPYKDDSFLALCRTFPWSGGLYYWYKYPSCTEQILYSHIDIGLLLTSVSEVKVDNVSCFSVL